MLVFELIQNHLTPLREYQPVSDAIKVMEDQNLYHYPIVQESTGKLVGQASLDHYRNFFGDKSEAVEYGLGSDRVLLDSDHILDAAHTMYSNGRNILPVVDRSGSYMGVVLRSHLIDAVTRLLNLGESGTVIMIEMEPRDFMLSDVIRIIEAEGARIMSMTIQAPGEGLQRFRVSVKLNLDDLKRVGSALRRYGYLITSESHSEQTEAEFSDKADEFLKYLDI